MDSNEYDGEWMPVRHYHSHLSSGVWSEWLRHDGSIVIGQHIQATMHFPEKDEAQVLGMSGDNRGWCVIVSPTANIYRPHDFTHFRDCRRDDVGRIIKALRP